MISNGFSAHSFTQSHTRSLFIAQRWLQRLKLNALLDNVLPTYLLLGKRHSISKDWRLLAFCCFFLCDDICHVLFDPLSFLYNVINYRIATNTRYTSGQKGSVDYAIRNMIPYHVSLIRNASYSLRRCSIQDIEIVSDWFMEIAKCFSLVLSRFCV